ADVAVFAISAADLVGGSNHAGPYRSCGSLRNGFPLERCLALGRELLISLFDDLSYLAGIQVASQFGVYHSRMHSRSAHALISVASVEGDCEEDIRCLRSAIRYPGVIRRPLKVGIVEVDIGIAVTQRGKIDQPSAFADQRCYPIDQDKMAKVIGAELRLKAIRGMAKRCGHHSGISDDHIKGLTAGEQSIDAVMHALEIGK